MDNFEKFDEDFNFKPITSGLGFKTAREDTEVIKKVNRSISLEAKPKEVKSFQHKDMMDSYSSELKAFYEREVNKSTHVKDPEFSDEPIILNATSDKRAVAFVLDMIIIFLMTYLFTLSFKLTAQIDLVELAWSKDNLAIGVMSFLFSSFYFFYFLILEKSTGKSCGKEILSIQVVDLNNNTLSFKSLFLRTTISLLGFLSLGVSNLMNLHGKISSSKVIES